MVQWLPYDESARRGSLQPLIAALFGNAFLSARAMLEKVQAARILL
jgi:hypothetical protein